MNSNGNGLVVFLFSCGKPSNAYLQADMCMSVVDLGWSCFADSKTARNSDGWSVSGTACPSTGGASRHLCKFLVNSSWFTCDLPGFKNEPLGRRKPGRLVSLPPVSQESLFILGL